MAKNKLARARLYADVNQNRSIVFRENASLSSKKSNFKKITGVVQIQHS